MSPLHSVHLSTSIPLFVCQLIFALVCMIMCLSVVRSIIYALKGWKVCLLGIKPNFLHFYDFVQGKAKFTSSCQYFFSDTKISQQGDSLFSPSHDVLISFLYYLSVCICSPFFLVTFHLKTHARILTFEGTQHNLPSKCSFNSSCTF